MMLAKLVRYTPDEQPDKSQLVMALNKVREIATAMREARQHAENSSRVLEIQNKTMQGLGVTIVRPGRHLIRK